MRHLADAGEIATHVIRQVTINRNAYGEGTRHCEKGAAIGFLLRDMLRADHAASADAVIDDHADLPCLGHVFGDEPHDDIGAAAGGERDDEAHRLRGVVSGGFGLSAGQCRHD